jgi:hypothetical protein
MADETKQEQTEQPENAGISGDSTSQGGRSYSQAQLDRMFAERAKQAESALLKRLGIEKPEDAEALIKRAREVDEAAKSELQKAVERGDTLEREKVEILAKQRDMQTQTDIAFKAQKVGIIDADAAFKLLDKKQLEYGEDGLPTNTEALLKTLLAEKPYLAGGGNSSAANPAKQAMAFTKAQIENMSPEQINKNWDAVKGYLERGR